MAFTLAQQMVRTVSIFQGLLALVVLWSTAACALDILAYSNPRIYAFTASIFITLFAAGIIVAVWVQYKILMSHKITLYFELAKSAFATIIWLWLILDAAFGPGINRYPRSRPRKPLVVNFGISVIILFILYYPTLVWAYIDKRLYGEAFRTPERGQDQDEDAAGEREPLLR